MCYDIRYTLYVARRTKRMLSMYTLTDVRCPVRVTTKSVLMRDRSSFLRGLRSHDSSMNDLVKHWNLKHQQSDLMHVLR